MESVRQHPSDRNSTLRRLRRLLLPLAFATVIALTVMPTQAAFAYQLTSEYSVSLNGTGFKVVPASYTIPANAASTTTARTVQARIRYLFSGVEIASVTKNIRWTWNSKRVYKDYRTVTPSTGMFCKWNGIIESSSNYNSACTYWRDYVRGSVTLDIVGVSVSVYPAITTQSYQKGKCIINFDPGT